MAKVGFQNGVLTAETIILPSQPSLLVNLNAPIANGWGDAVAYIVKFNTIVYGTGYDASTGLYTAANTGKYLINTAVNLTDTGGAGSNAELSAEAGTRDIQLDAAAFVANIPNNFINVQGSEIVQLTAGQTIGIYIEGNTAAGTKTGTFYGDAAGVFTWLSIHFLG